MTKEELLYKEYRDGYDLLRSIVTKYNLEPLAPQIYRSDRVDSLWKLKNKGFEILAWTPNVRYLLFNPKKRILISDIEGDLYIYKNPTKETLENKIQKYPKGEVSLGEKYDSRFPSQSPDKPYPYFEED